MNNDLSKMNNECPLTDEQLIKLGREVVNWTVPTPSMTTYEEVAAAFESRCNWYGRFVGFADAISDVIFGGGCGWTRVSDGNAWDGLEVMADEVRNKWR